MQFWVFCIRWFPVKALKAYIDCIMFYKGNLMAYKRIFTSYVHSIHILHVDTLAMCRYWWQYWNSDYYYYYHWDKYWWRLGTFGKAVSLVKNNVTLFDIWYFDSQKANKMQLRVNYLVPLPHTMCVLLHNKSKRDFRHRPRHAAADSSQQMHK